MSSQLNPSKPQQASSHSLLGSHPHKLSVIHQDQLLLTAATHINHEGSNSRKGKYTGCNCSKSQCLKMYCACFSVGRMCDETCLCQSCKNDSDNMDRSEAISEIIDRDPLAFSRKYPSKELTEGICNCRKSGCQKKYCECFRSGRQCGQLCQCQGCKNHENDQSFKPTKPTKLVKLQ